MIICPRCGIQLPDNSRFCNICGFSFQSNYQQQQYTYQQSGNSQYHYPQPVNNDQKPSIAKAIVSAGLSGEAVALAVLNFFYTFLFIVAKEPEVALGLTIILSVFIIPFAIVGMVFGNGYLNSNAIRIKGLAKAGLIMGIISLILIGLCFFVGIGVCA